MSDKSDKNYQDYAVLLVDDQAEVIKYLKKQLEFNGDHFTILSAASAEEALAIVNSSTEDIALLISDQRMPGKSGNALIQEIKQSHPEMIRILTSAFGEVDAAIEAVNLGDVFQYVTKPWDAPTMAAIMRRGIDAHVKLLAQKTRLKSALDERANGFIAEVVSDFSILMPDFSGKAALITVIERFLMQLTRLVPGSESLQALFVNFNVQNAESTTRSRIDIYRQLMSDCSSTEPVEVQKPVQVPVRLILTAIGNIFPLIEPSGVADQSAFFASESQYLRLISRLLALSPHHFTGLRLTLPGSSPGSEDSSHRQFIPLTWSGAALFSPVSVLRSFFVGSSFQSAQTACLLSIFWVVESMGGVAEFGKSDDGEVFFCLRLPIAPGCEDVPG